MTNEEYAIELAENISPYDIGGDNAAHYAAKDAALEAMQWKDEQHKQEKQQWIDKVGEWINDNYFEYLQPISYHEQLQNSIDINDFVNDLKKSMEEQL